MKKLVLSLALVLVSSFAIGQELTKEQIKEQKKQKKALMNMVTDAEAKISVDPVGVANAVKTALKNPLVNTDPYVWYVSVSAKKAIVDGENRKRAEGAECNEPMMYLYVHELGNDLANLEKYDNTPDAKGRVKPKHAEFVNVTYAQEFGQFFNGGAYYYNEQDFNKAYDIVKAINTRSRMDTTAIKKPLSQSAFQSREGALELILKERLLELTFEGKRWYDLVQKALIERSTKGILELITKKLDSNAGAVQSKMASINSLFCPIYERELKLNPLLKQNPAFESNSSIEQN
jgi:hypothetical protein